MQKLTLKAVAGNLFLLLLSWLVLLWWFKQITNGVAINWHYGMVWLPRLLIPVIAVMFFSRLPRYFVAVMIGAGLVLGCLSFSFRTLYFSSFFPVWWLATAAAVFLTYRYALSERRAYTAVLLLPVLLLPWGLSLRHFLQTGIFHYFVVIKPWLYWVWYLTPCLLLLWLAKKTPSDATVPAVAQEEKSGIRVSALIVVLTALLPLVCNLVVLLSRGIPLGLYFRGRFVAPPVGSYFTVQVILPFFVMSLLALPAKVRRDTLLSAATVFLLWWLSLKVYLPAYFVRYITIYDFIIAFNFYFTVGIAGWFIAWVRQLSRTGVGAQARGSFAATFRGFVIGIAAAIILAMISGFLMRIFRA